MRFALALVALLFAGNAGALVDSAPKVQARLVAETGQIAPGGSIAVALEQNIRPGWHTYWRNPGEAGLPTEIKWTLPPGWAAGPIQWPYPKRLPVGPLMNYGYEGKVWLLTRLTAPRLAKPGDTVTLAATGSWLVCKEVCIPEDQTLSLPLTISASAAAPYATVKDQFDAARAKIPTASPWPVRFHLGNVLDLFIASSTLASAHLKDATFFPLAGGEIVDFAPQTFAPAADGLVLHLKAAKAPKIGAALNGVVVLTSADGSVQALSVAATRGSVPNTANVETSANGVTLLMALLFALLGGIVLNLMPCVLPVLAMKALALATSAHGDRREATRESFAYGAGAVLSFLLFGAAIAALRAAGEAIGWGFQLQNPIVVGGFALLIFVVGLNLSGVFEVPGIGVGEGLTRRGGRAGAFFTGVLAVAVAAPCTAPFMAAALGYALTQDLARSLLVFLALGIGFAAPFVLIGLSSMLTRWLPKPGAWMQRFREFLAFPMYATALWLVWVLSLQTDLTRALVLLGLALVLAFALWVFGATQGRADGWRMVGWLALLLGAIAVPAIMPTIGQGAATSRPAAEVSGLSYRAYSGALLQKLRQRNRPVFVNATAAWCITCLVNEKVAFSSTEVQHVFAQKQVGYLVADWTNRNPEITALLQAHGRSGVPLYLYYAPGAAQPTVLPQVLTPGEILKAVSP
ncbi:MAG TPA: protein-disulfide reductase DsbD domain-containing protein [Rhizomicrobium sp.]|nr:protein-disulfide reductase DsbD domain-containing protein [Rhizomicrobium sp.]